MVNMDQEAAKQEIVNFLESKSGTKTKFYFNDFTKLFPDMKQREVKKLLSALVQEGKMTYFSSGSTTLYSLTGAGKTAEG